MKLTDEQLRAEATARVRRAMVLIENAQNELLSACQELSALEGGYALYRSTSKLCDRVRTLWYRVESFYKRGRYCLDGTNIEALQRRAAAQQPQACEE